MTGPDDTPWTAPRANPELWGHETAERILLDAYRLGRPGQAWLITGPRGIGKATLAYRYARYVLAGGGANMALDPESGLFQRVSSGGHADFRTVERGWDEEKGRRRHEIAVADVRDMGNFMHLTPAEGGWRVLVIDAAEDMNRNAANAVLKVLEEPPSRAMILLISHAPGRLLATIRSRCLRLALRPLSEDVLGEIVGRSFPELGPEDLAALSRLSEGSAGRALELAAEGGLTLYRDMLALLESLPRLDGVGLHALGDRLARPAADAAYRTTSEVLVWWLRRLIRRAATGEEGPEVVSGEGALLDRLANIQSLEHWIEVWEKVSRLFARADGSNLGRKQVVLNAFLTLESPVPR